MIYTEPPRHMPRRARMVHEFLSVNAIYLLPSDKLARYRGLSDDGFEFWLVDPHRAEDLPSGQLALSDAMAGRATLAYSAQAWRERHEHHQRVKRWQDGEGAVI